MKIVHKIILANVFDILLIALTGFFAYQNLNLVLAKLKFMEIADDLNASFLEMRLAEKNYFLYGDKSALSDIGEKIAEGAQTMDSTRADIVRAIGAKKFDQLESSLSAYGKAIEQAKVPNPNGESVQKSVREAGQVLREYSRNITHMERGEVNEIIGGSRNGLFSSLVLILLSAVGVTHFISLKVLESLKQIERVTHLISEGDYSKIESTSPRDECTLVIEALNSMTEELKHREEQIIQAKKLASIGILTAGVAHEVGNPLNNISMMAQTYIELYDNLSRDDRIDFMVKIEEETERIQRIVKELLDFSKPKKPDLKEAAINEVVEKTMRLVQNVISVCNIDVQLHLQENLPAIFIDEHQFQEVLINLITNALHASCPGDSLLITTRMSPGEENVEIEVEDHGKGIPPELLPHVFDPFFTTKGASGTGLGLFVSYGIIKNHRGNIKVRSTVDEGTCFTIELPACDQPKGA